MPLQCFFVLSSLFSYQLDFIKLAFLSLDYEKNRLIKCSFPSHVCPSGNPDIGLLPSPPYPCPAPVVEKPHGIIAGF